MNASLSNEERMSAFKKNMEKGGWLDKNASRFGNEWSRAWLVVSNLSFAPSALH